MLLEFTDHPQKPDFIHQDKEVSVHCYSGKEQCEIVYRLNERPFFIIDFALEQDFLSGRLSISEGWYTCCFSDKQERKIAATGKNAFTYLSVAFTLSGFEKIQTGTLETKGRISPAMLLLILKIIHSQNQPVKSEQWISTHLRLLAFEIRSANQINVGDAIAYSDAVRIFNTLEMIAKNPQPTFTGKSAAESAGLKYYLFQKGCRQLYTVSFKKILHGLLMEKAINLIIFSNRTLEDISLQMGYSSRENFITAFKQQYDITPLAIRNYYRNRQPGVF